MLRTFVPLSAPIGPWRGGEGRGEVGDARAPADTHLTLPIAAATDPLPLRPEGQRGQSGPSHASTFFAAVGLLLTLAGTAFAQKPGGILRVHALRLAAEPVDARGDRRRPGAGDDGGLQQPRHVRPARRTEQPQIGRAGSGDRLVVERGRDPADLSVAPRASNGMTAGRSPPRTSNAPGTCCSANRMTSCASIRANRGTATSPR